MFLFLLLQSTFCFCLLAFYLLKRTCLPAFGPRSTFFHGLPCGPVTESNQHSMGPAGKLTNIRQGDGSIEEYAGRFWEVARRSATEKTCLLVFFWGGLSEPFKSRMPYWNPEELLEDYLNLALHLSGSAFRVGSMAASAHLAPEVAASAPEAAVPPHTAPKMVASAHGSPEVAVPAHIPLEAAVTIHQPPKASSSFLGHLRPITSVQDPPLMSVREALSVRVLSEEVVRSQKAPKVTLTESAPEPAPFREQTESAPEPAPFPGADRVRSRARSVPGADRVRSRARSVPGADRVRSRARSVPGAHAVRSVLGAHAVLRPFIY